MALFAMAYHEMECNEQLGRVRRYLGKVRANI